MTKYKWFLFALVAVLAMALSAFLACSSSGGDDDDDDTTGDDTNPFDDDGDDDSDCSAGMTAVYDCGYVLGNETGDLSLADAIAWCESGDTVVECFANCGLTEDCDSLGACMDNCIGDDDADDDDDTNAPVLSDGGWDPPAFTWTPDCEDETAEEACTTLIWYVCDPDNNMLPDGMFYIYAAGTTEAFFVGGPGMAVSDFNFTTEPDFSNCDSPIGFGIGLLMPEDMFPEPGTYELACDIEATDNDGNLSNKLTDLATQVTYEG